MEKLKDWRSPQMIMILMQTSNEQASIRLAYNVSFCRVIKICYTILFDLTFLTNFYMYVFKIICFIFNLNFLLFQLGHYPQMHNMQYQAESGHTVGPYGPSMPQTQLQRASWVNFKPLEYNSPIKSEKEKCLLKSISYFR